MYPNNQQIILKNRNFLKINKTNSKFIDFGGKNGWLCLNFQRKILYLCLFLTS